MKKQIISVLLLISLSFQSAYSISSQVYQVAAKGAAGTQQKGSVMQRLARKYGVSKVASAIATIKRYTPRGLITRYKQTKNEYQLANKAYWACLHTHCLHVRKAEVCRKEHCSEQENAMDVAYQRYDKLQFNVHLAAQLGLIAATAAAAITAGVVGHKYDQQAKKEARLSGETENRPKEWLGKSPFYEEKKQWSDPSPLHEPKPKRLKQ